MLVFYCQNIMTILDTKNKTIRYLHFFVKYYNFYYCLIANASGLIGELEDGEYNFNTCLPICRHRVDFNFMMYLINYSASTAPVFRK